MEANLKPVPTNTLRVSYERYIERRDRLRKLIELNAPPIVIHMATRTLECSFKRRTFSEWLMDWKYGCYRLRSWPHWLLYLVDSDYRNATKDIDLHEVSHGTERQHTSE